MGHLLLHVRAASGGSAPTITSVDKSLGDASGGTAITALVNSSTGCTAMDVCGVACTGFTIVDATHVRGTTGAMTASATPGAVGVTNGGGRGALASAFEAFWPTNLSNITLWLRADGGVNLTTGHVSSWTDSSVAGNSCAGTTGWTVATNWSNGKPAVLTDGTTGLTGATAPTTSGGACSYFFVGDNPGLGAGTGTVGGSVLVTRPTGGYLSMYQLLASGTQYVESDGSTNVTLAAANNAPFAAPVHCEWILPATGGVPSIYIAGALQTIGAGTRTADSGTGGYQLGIGPAFNWAGHYGEVVARNATTTGPELARLTAYFKDRYGLAA